LKGRGLDSAKITMGIMDGLPGLEKVFAEEFPGAKVQRCQVMSPETFWPKVPQNSKRRWQTGCAPSSMHLPRRRRGFFAEFKQMGGPASFGGKESGKNPLMLASLSSTSPRKMDFAQDHKYHREA